jgi:predicted ester cyclase
MKLTSVCEVTRWFALAALAAAACTTPNSRSTHMTHETTEATDQNKQLVERLFETFNHGDLGIVDTLVGDEYVGAQGDKGPAGFKAVVAGLRAAFPDLHYTLDEVIAEGDRVAVRWHWTGTHQGTFRKFAATGKAVTNTGAGIFRLRGGKIVAAELETDRLGFLEQIGAVPAGVGGGPRSPAAARP